MPAVPVGVPPICRGFCFVFSLIPPNHSSTNIHPLLIVHAASGHFSLNEDFQQPRGLILRNYSLRALLDKETRALESVASFFFSLFPIFFFLVLSPFFCQLTRTIISLSLLGGPSCKPERIALSNCVVLFSLPSVPSPVSAHWHCLLLRCLPLKDALHFSYGENKAEPRFLVASKLHCSLPRTFPLPLRTCRSHPSPRFCPTSYYEYIHSTK